MGLQKQSSSSRPSSGSISSTQAKWRQASFRYPSLPAQFVTKEESRLRERLQRIYEQHGHTWDDESKAAWFDIIANPTLTSETFPGSLHNHWLYRQLTAANATWAHAVVLREMNPTSFHGSPSILQKIKEKYRAARLRSEDFSPDMPRSVPHSAPIKGNDTQMRHTMVKLESLSPTNLLPKLFSSNRQDEQEQRDGASKGTQARESPAYVDNGTDSSSENERDNEDLDTPVPQPKRTETLSDDSLNLSQRGRPRRLRHSSLKDMFPEALPRVLNKDKLGVYGSSPPQPPLKQQQHCLPISTPPEPAAARPSSSSMVVAIPQRDFVPALFKTPSSLSAVRSNIFASPVGPTIEDRITKLESRLSGGSSATERMTEVDTRLARLEERLSACEALTAKYDRLESVVARQQEMLEQAMKWMTAAQRHGVPLPMAVLTELREK
jgi:uncharacterized coiled-coil protein SlyX